MWHLEWRKEQKDKDDKRGDGETYVQQWTGLSTSETILEAQCREEHETIVYVAAKAGRTHGT